MKTLKDFPEADELINLVADCHSLGDSKADTMHQLCDCWPRWAIAQAIEYVYARLEA